jgi:hypothetical protein
MTKPTIGRMVHFVMPHGHPAQGAIRPATLTKIKGDDVVNLRVILDPEDRVGLAPEEQTAVPFGITGQPGTWHWPARE